jgi:tRNA(Ile)-lysidine synthase
MQILDAIQKQKHFHKGSQILVAVSGGVDSVVLLHALHACQINCVVAHCNFQLRGDESERDEAFVRELGMQFGFMVCVKKFDTTAYAEANKCSVQVAARELRYAWFAELLQEKNLDFLATAHHQDDNVETVLMQFFKGTGIAGMRGMEEKKDKIIRPLLQVSKQAILLYANEHQLKCVEDSSNASDKYTRNFFRQQIIPAVEKVYPSAMSNAANTIAHLSDVEILYQQQIDTLRKKMIQQNGNDLGIAILKLQQQPAAKTVLYELLKPYGFITAQLNDVLHLMDAETGKAVYSGTHCIFKNRKWLTIAPLQAKEAKQILIEEGNAIVQYGDKQLQLKKMLIADWQLSTANNVAQVDAAKLHWPLILRKYKTGDYLYPFGMKGKKKKLSRMLIDLKVSKSDKENVWVLESDKKIVWVMGYRIDERFCITAKTKEVIVFNC